jgi:hypothetical protein
MGTTRIDRFARTLAGPGDRRTLVGLLAGLAVSGAVLPPAAGAAAAGKKCKPCRRKRRGKCRGKKPDGTLCGAARECCDGQCVAECGTNEQRDPATCGCCLRAGEVCDPGPAACCSQRCVGQVGGTTFFCAVAAP